jgi:predicted phage terminase large subunit-like protein
MTTGFLDALTERLEAPAGEGGFASPLDLACAGDPRFVRTPALELVNEALVWAERTPDARLIITLAPQEGKSSLASRWCTTWALQRNPRRRVAITSYADRLARRWGRRVRNDIAVLSGDGNIDLGLRMAPDQKAADEWELLGTEGGVYTAGVGGSLTGRPVDWLLIDDPVKGRKEAQSQVVSEDVWEWWQGTASARLAPGAPVIVILTRWAHDDLAGRLMVEQPGVWRVVHIPAQCDPAVLAPDPLGRAPGEFMVSARGRTVEQWERRKEDAGDEWQPLYQGDPKPPGGQTFDITKIQHWTWGTDHLGRDAIRCGVRVWALADCFRFGTIDTASSTKTSADFTVASAWAVPPDGSLVLLDVVRDRLPPHKQIDAVRPLVARWQLGTVKVEPNLKSTELVRAAVREGLPVEDVVADRSKELRATLAAQQMDRGMVWFPAGHRLLDVITREVDEFPNGRHDDFVDTLAYAANTRFEEWVPPSGSAPRPPVREPDYGLGSIVDPMRQEW